jgi:hypothetical protein
VNCSSSCFNRRRRGARSQRAEPWEQEAVQATAACVTHDRRSG